MEKNSSTCAPCLDEIWDNRWDYNINKDKSKVGKSILGLLSKEFICGCVKYKYMVMLVKLC